MLTSGMACPEKYCRFMAIALTAAISIWPCSAQAPSHTQTPETSLLDRLNAMITGGKSAWSDEQLRTMARLRDAAMTSSYAYDELRHLTDNIGPRLSGSPQAQMAVDWVAGQMRTEGAEVTLEKAQVPHWVRGAEMGELTAWPGQAPGTSQRIVLTALGGSVA